MNDSLQGQVIVVTGASSGMGKAIALESARRGAKVVLIARRQVELEKVASQVRDLGGEVVVLPADLSKADAISTLFQRLVQAVKQVDVLVNAAGFGKFGEFVHSDMQTVTDMFQVNVLGLMYFTRLVGRLMIDQKHGQIVNFGSIAGKVPTAKSAAYSASKAAVIQFSNVLRLELKPFGVHVMTVNPGPVYTNFFNIADASGKYLQNVEAFVLDPDDVAWEVVHFFGTNKRELNLPLSLSLACKFYNLFPTIGDYISLKVASLK
ncbi:MAG: SDR family oxidoreductase [Lactobacillus sp.]|jgi:short-subunit dehydrogenase|nr:SDR family oxidoreductase [Lactobacillus sp.]MCI1481310.1 SDR family oxidoreductase [Lactobacillus sp.]